MSITRISCPGANAAPTSSGGESPEGGPDLAELAAALQAPDGTLVICALSAASNVTGIVADVPAITRLVKQSGAKMLWDYAGGAPYLSIQMSPAADAQIDAIVFSPHKFIGGPGASGVLIVRRDAVTETTPAWPGGGTVKFVSPAGHDYSGSLESREERAPRTSWAISAPRWSCW